MGTVKIDIKDIIGTPNAIIQRFGFQVFDYVSKQLIQGLTVELDFGQLSNITSGFCNASIGQLYSEFPEIAEQRIKFINLDKPIWKEKIDESIILAKNPAKAQQLDEAILALFD